MEPEVRFEGIASWINSEPLTLRRGRGNVVLVDFWTYTCINRIRTLPYVKDWHDKYAHKGLVVAGVHSSEFDFERARAGVIAAAKKDGLEYPYRPGQRLRLLACLRQRLLAHQEAISKSSFGESRGAFPLWQEVWGMCPQHQEPAGGRVGRYALLVEIVTKYLIDRQGVIRYTHIGQGDCEQTERMIRLLLDEPGA